MGIPRPASHGVIRPLIGDNRNIEPRNGAYRDDDMNSGASKNINDIDLNHNAGNGYNPDRVGNESRVGSPNNGMSR